MNEEMTYKPVVINGVTHELYEVSTEGKVRNKKTGEILRVYDNNEECLVLLAIDGKYILFPLARIVLGSFDIRPSNHDERTVCFKDARTDNVNLDNLVWTSATPWWTDGRIVLNEEDMQAIKRSGIKNPGRHEYDLAKSLNLPLSVVRRALFGSLKKAKEIERKEQEELQVILKNRMDAIHYNEIIREDIEPLLHIGMDDDKILELMLFKYDEETHDYFKENLETIKKRRE